MAADTLDALLDEALPDDQPSTPDAEDAARPETETETEAEAKWAELDALIPDTENVPEEYRNKSIADLIRISQQHRQQIHVATEKSRDYNDLASKNRVLEAGIDWLRNEITTRQQPLSQPAQPEPTETAEALLDRLSQNPGEVIDERMRRQLEPLQRAITEQQRTIAEQTERTVWANANYAREQARANLNIAPDVWEQMTPQLAAIAATRQLNIEDPRVWDGAAREYLNNLRYFMPSPATAPAVSVPTVAAPPGGSARSTVRPVTSGPKLRLRDDENSNDLLDAFEIKDPARRKEFKQYIATRKEA